MITTLLDSIGRQRKYTLAWFFSIAGTVLTILGKLDIVFVELAAIILGLYGAANVGEKYVGTTKSTQQ